MRGITYLLGEVLEQRDVTPSLHVCSLEGAELLELGFLRVLVQGCEEALVEDEILVALFVVDFDVGEVGMHAKCKI